MNDSKHIVVIATINIPLGDFLAINLEKFGFDVLIAPDIKSALFLIKTTNPTHIIIDTLLPAHGALYLISKINQENDKQDIKIVLLDASSQDGYKKQYSNCKLIRQDVEPQKLVVSLTTEMR